MRYTYDRAKQAMRNALDDLHILAGDKVGQGDVTWQDVAGTAAVNLRHLAHLIDQAREGNATAREPIVFPSPDDLEGGR